MQGLVDIILPTHRRPHTIACAIQSVLQQTHADFRLHIIGDGCDETTEALARSVRDPRVTFRRFPKQPGYGYANRNTVLRETDGEFVAYLCDDDLWFPDHLERGLAELRARDVGLVAFRSCAVRFPRSLDPHFFSFDWQAGAATRLLRQWFTGSVECVHRREVFGRVGYWNERLFRFGDREFSHRVRASEVPTAYVDVVTVLRFYAMYWDRLYGSLPEAPQKQFVERLLDPAWCGDIRRCALPGPRDWAVRVRQWTDFTRFGVHSGPRFLRFWGRMLAAGQG